ncbi:MAG: hypothetical protein MJZ20_10325 [Bacteroidaceae bacterium]|nr:hypothetical protein [Bacteroidaceae bacterium]
MIHLQDAKQQLNADVSIANDCSPRLKSQSGLMMAKTLRFAPIVPLTA